MILLIDIGNTNTHLGVADDASILQTGGCPTPDTTVDGFIGCLQKLTRGRIEGAVLCSVVPERTATVQTALRQAFGFPAEELTARSVRGVGVDYPEPASIGPDRLANAIAARHHHGAPSVVVDFGTAVTFDVINARGNYLGGIIAPGISAMTDYLHEKTALLPRITIEEPRSVIGRSTKEAMLSGAVHGYRGLIAELLSRLKAELNDDRLPVVATGGYAELMATNLPLIDVVDPNLTLEGLRLFAMEGRQPAVE